MGAKSDMVAMGTLVAVLAVTALTIFVWIANTGWADHTGIVTAVIFVVLTGAQSVVGFVWWKSAARNLPKSVDSPETDRLTELTTISAKPNNV